MSNQYLLPVILIVLQYLNKSSSTYLNVEPNYQKQLLDRHNKINKGIWIKNKLKERFEKNRLEDFIFRPNSLDTDSSPQQGSFNGFGDLQGTPVVMNYMDRVKRSPENGTRKAKRSISNNFAGDKTVEGSKFISKLKTTFNYNPYEIAMLLNNNKKELDTSKNISEIFDSTVNSTNITIPVMDIKTNDTSINVETLIKENTIFKNIYNITNESNMSATKRNMEIPYVAIIQPDSNKDDELIAENYLMKKVDRDVFEKVENIWRPTPIIPESSNYIQKNEDIDYDNKHKPITERGLVRILAMLTRTFKKIFRQHEDIKEIHRRMHDINSNFVKNAGDITTKLKAFDRKFEHLNEHNEKLKYFEEKFNTKELYFKNKEAELSKNLIEFENQQKKFLTQQRQFYNIQKLMLAQNEKINAKQNLIAKTQSEISRRQNNFARILKKAKQIYIDKRPSNTNLATIFNKSHENNNMSQDYDSVTHTTTAVPKATESIKINLFSIPTLTRLENQDDLILNEKDTQPVDELIYKYYFNNTFLDDLMKNKVLSSFISTQDNAQLGNTKIKRNEIPEIQTTLLLPFKKASNGILQQFVEQSLNRKRRWINHHSQRKSRRRNRGKGNAEILIDDAKNAEHLKYSNNQLEPQSKPLVTTTTPVEANVAMNDIGNTFKSDPFLTMATSFCVGVGQNQNQQMLDWCVEKALRKLQSIDNRMPTPSAPLGVVEDLQVPKLLQKFDNKQLNLPQSKTMPPTVEQSTTTSSTSAPSSATSTISISTTTTPVSTTMIPGIVTPIYNFPKMGNRNLYNFFPDNDQLESNLMQYDLKPDTEGNVYYDGSVHASQIVFEKSEGFSDLLLDQLESNSRIDVDPETFNLQAKRRAYVRKLNESILKKMSNRHA